MSNGMTVYDGGAVAPYVGESDGAVTHALNSPAVTSEDRAIIADAGNVFAAHGLDRQKSMQAAEKWYAAHLASLARGDDNDRKEVRSQMQREWGANYGANVKRIKAFIDTLPLSLQDVLWEGRTGDNTLALNDPSVLRWLLRLTQPAGGYPSQSVDAEINEILNVMRKDRTRYNRDTGMQQRLRQLNAMKG